MYDFVRSFDGCEDHAEEFKSQEIDGAALLLLTQEHLISTMKMKLGPALKIFAKIRALESGDAA